MNKNIHFRKRGGGYTTRKSSMTIMTLSISKTIHFALNDVIFMSLCSQCNCYLKKECTIYASTLPPVVKYPSTYCMKVSEHLVLICFTSIKLGLQVKGSNPKIANTSSNAPYSITIHLYLIGLWFDVA